MLLHEQTKHRNHSSPSPPLPSPASSAPLGNPELFYAVTVSIYSIGERESVHAPPLPPERAREGARTGVIIHPPGVPEGGRGIQLDEAPQQCPLEQARLQPTFCILVLNYLSSICILMPDAGCVHIPRRNGWIYCLWHGLQEMVKTPARMNRTHSHVLEDTAEEKSERHQQTQA